MSILTRAPLAFFIGAVALGGGIAHADDRLNTHPWDYQVRGSASATARATMIWQAEQAGGSGGLAGSAAASGASGGPGGLPSVGSVANMNVITVVVGDNSVVDLATHADQQNTGALSANANATAVTATGGAVDVGRIGSAANTTQGSTPQ